MNQGKSRFESLLTATGRKGMGNVLKELDALGFYEAPASTRFHGACPGGLLEHSLQVYDEAIIIRNAQLQMKPEVATQLPSASIAIAVRSASHKRVVAVCFIENILS